VLEEAHGLAGDLPVVALNDADRLKVSDKGNVTHLAWGSDGWKAASTEPHR